MGLDGFSCKIWRANFLQIRLALQDKDENNHMYWRLVLIVSEIILITALHYEVASAYYSLGVLYCLPIIQASRLSASRTGSSGALIPAVTGVLGAVAWSIADSAVLWPFPLDALALNIFIRAVTFTVLAQVMTTLFKERKYSRKDALTGLANRLEFFERFELEQLRSERSGAPYSVLFVDIDQFKVLNDTRGHHTGDEALKALARVFAENSRKLDTVARIGGDEFALLFPSTDGKTCETLIERITLVANGKFSEQGWPITLSTGYVTETGKKRSAEDVLREADEKMYSIKKAKLPQ